MLEEFVYLNLFFCFFVFLGNGRIKKNVTHLANAILTTGRYYYYYYHTVSEYNRIVRLYRSGIHNSLLWPHSTAVSSQYYYYDRLISFLYRNTRLIQIRRRGIYRSGVQRRACLGISVIRLSNVPPTDFAFSWSRGHDGASAQHEPTRLYDVLLRRDSPTRSQCQPLLVARQNSLNHRYTVRTH